MRRLREFVLDIPNLLVRRFDIRGFEGRPTHQESKNDNSEGPYVDLVGVATACIRVINDLGRYVVGCTANSPFALALKVELGRQAEVSELDLHACREEEVAELEVAVEDAVAVQMLDPSENLQSITLDLDLSEALASFEHFIESLIRAELQQYVNVFGILEKVLKPNNVWVLQRPMDPNLTHQLPTSSITNFTFCLARDLRSVVFGMILAAVTFLVSRLVSSWHYAKPPYKKVDLRRLLCRGSAL